MELSTPALMFGAISLILLAFSNRFHTLASLIRSIHANRSGESRALEIQQIPLLKKRLYLIKSMQAFGVLSFLFCTASFFFLFIENHFLGKLLFLISVFTLFLSLAISFFEVILSTQALDLLLEDWNENNENN